MSNSEQFFTKLAMSKLNFWPSSSMYSKYGYERTALTTVYEPFFFPLNQLLFSAWYIYMMTVIVKLRNVIHTNFVSNDYQLIK